MNTRHARMILTIVREGSFTAAARALSITQPTLSQTVRQAEAQLGESIFVRGKSPATLTPAGSLYVEAARRIIQAETQLEESISLLHGHASGTLRLGLPHHRSEELIPQIYADFLSAYPDVHLEVYEMAANSLEPMLLRDELDIALLIPSKPHPRLSYRQVEAEEIVLVAGKQTALAQRIPSGSTIGLREAAQERFTLLTRDHVHRPLLDQLLSACSLEPSVCMYCDNIVTAMRACASAHLVMLCPFISLLCDSGMMQKLSHYHLGTDACLPPFYIAYPKDRPLVPYAEAFYGMIHNRFRAMTAYRP